MAVYLLGVVEGCHKIGRSCVPEARAVTFKHLPSRPKLIHVIESIRDGWLERYLHMAFLRQKSDGHEWFRLTEEDIALLCSIKRANRERDLPVAIRKKYRLLRTPRHADCTGESPVL